MDVQAVRREAWPLRGVDRRAGVALVGFGMVGLATLVALVLVAIVALGPLVAGVAELDERRASAASALETAAAAIDSTATAATNGAVSLANAEAAARDAAQVTRQLADAMATLASFSASFAETADRSRSLSDSLSRTADGLHQNQVDSTTAAAELQDLSAGVRDLATALGSDRDLATGGAAISIGVPLLIGLIGLLLGWLGALALASVWLGRRILRGASRA